MKKMSETIVFFGSGPVAAESLQLLAQDFEIEAVVTKPKPIHHTGSFPVLDVAEKLQLSVHTVSSRTELSQLIVTKPFKSRVGVLIDFGIIVSQDVIDYFPLGIVNSHFSLLPEWRGADPISFAILSGQKRTGVSLMLLVEKMDEGPVLATTPLELPKGITAPQLTEELIDLSYKSLKEILPLYLKGVAKPLPQDTKVAPTYSRKLTKEDGLIDWSKTAEQIEREVRAFIEWPKSRATIAGKEVIITEAHVAGYEYNAPSKVVGKVFPVPFDLIGVACGKGVLVIDKLKPAGKREMTAKEFLAGNRLA